jgi:hypothetical protein
MGLFLRGNRKPGKKKRKQERGGQEGRGCFIS